MIVSMKFLINLDFKKTLEIAINLVDPDPDELISVYSVTMPDSETIFFEALHNSELWDIVQAAIVAYKDFMENEAD